MNSKKKQELRKKAHELDATVRVGKGGIENVVDELERQLGNNEIIKAKFLRSARAGEDVEELAEDLAQKVDAEVVETRGSTAVFY